MIINNIKQRGAVSIFIVVFSALLITVVTIGFVGLMLQNQQQATATDLSQSAYDSAQAGVEDAKRALLYYQNVCSDNVLSASCVAITPAFASGAPCNAAVGTLSDVTVASGEVKVRANNVSNTLDQAYTCLKIDLQTDDYVGILADDSSKFIPLFGSADFDTIRLEWFSIKDLQGVGTTVNVPSFVSIGSPPLLSQTSWTSVATPNRPPIMRTQLVQFNSTSGFLLSDLDTINANAFNGTLFLYPTNIVDSTKTFSSDVERTAKSITQVNCSNSLASLVYSCAATITLPSIVHLGDHNSYLNLTSLYKKTNYRITLSNSNLPCNPITRVGVGCIKFNAVQPSVDSTGRANDLFRRVQTRVETTDVNFPYPEAAIDLAGDFCKGFSITDKASDYNVGNVGWASCTP